MNRRSFAVSSLLALPAFAMAGEQGRTTAQVQADHEAWVAATLKQMLAMQPGMTRGDLLKVCSPEGGLHTRQSQTFYSRQCVYFRVDVEFAVGPDARTGQSEEARDPIARISKPYLQIEMRLD